MLKSLLFNNLARRTCLLFTKSNSLETMSTPSKIAKPNPYVATHDNVFHCDDVTACQILKSLPQYKDHDIVRTRNEELLDKADVVFDVGSIFDADRLRLDHHQRSFNLTIKDFFPKLRTTNPDKPPRLSSAGLVYTIFGKDYISRQLELGSYKDLTEEKKIMIDALFEKAYTEIFEEIDAIDNGVEVVAGDDVVYNYHINSGISSRVERFNPVEKDASPELRLEQFKKAMQMVGDELSEGIRYLGNVWWPKRQEFKHFLMKRKEFDPSGQIIYFENEHPVGWKSAVFEIEEELGIVGEIKFIIYSNVSDESPWRAICVPTDPKSFLCRTPFPAEWRGLRAKELQDQSGIGDAAFVHYSGFTGGAKSLEGITTMVRRTLKLERQAE